MRKISLPLAVIAPIILIIMLEMIDIDTGGYLNNKFTTANFLNDRVLRHISPMHSFVINDFYNKSL